MKLQSRNAWPPFLLLLALFVYPSTAQDDLTQIRDKKAREAATTILDKLAVVDDYSCEAKFSTVTTIGSAEVRRVEFTDSAQIEFKRPNLGHNRSETLKHAYSWFEGQVIDTYFDGTYWWQYQQPAADSGEKLADFRKMIVGSERQRYIERHNKPRIYRYELMAFTDAGLEHLDRDYGDLFLRPFNDCDLESLAIEREDEDVWVFTAKPRRVYPMRTEFSSIRLTFGKADGVMRELFYDGGADQNRTVTISNVNLNPGLDDSAFRFTLPEGIEVTDNTEKMVKSLLGQRENWEKRESNTPTPTTQD